MRPTVARGRAASRFEAAVIYPARSTAVGGDWWELEGIPALCGRGRPVRVWFEYASDVVPARESRGRYAV